MSSMLGDLFGTLLDSMVFKFSRGQSMIKMIHFHQDWFCLFLHLDHVTWMDLDGFLHVFMLFSICCSRFPMFPWIFLFPPVSLASRFGHPTEDGRPRRRGSCVCCTGYSGKLNQQKMGKTDWKVVTKNQEKWWLFMGFNGICVYIYILVGGDWNHGLFWMTNSRNRNGNGMSSSQLLLTPSFFRGVGIPPTSDLFWLSCCKLIHWFHCCV